MNIMLRSVGMLAIAVFVALSGCSSGGGDDESTCGGPGGEVCPVGEFCNYPDFSCGNTGLEGLCKLIPVDCSVPSTETEITTPVCSCEGLEFFNECFAAAASQPIIGAGDCA